MKTDAKPKTKGSVVAQWILAVIALLFSIADFFTFAGVIFFIAAIFAAPIESLRNFFNKKISTKVLIVLSIILVLVGIMVTPASETENTNKNDVETNQNDHFENDNNINNSLNNDKNTNNNNNNSSGNVGDNNSDDENDKGDNEGNTNNSGSNNSESSNTGNKQKYILNTNSKKIHYPSCGMVSKISDKNKQEYVGDKDALFDQGYTECGVCH